MGSMDDLQWYINAVDNGHGIDSTDVRELTDEIDQLRAEVERLEAQIRTMYTEEQVRKHGESIATRCAEIADWHCCDGCEGIAADAIRKEFL